MTIDEILASLARRGFYAGIDHMKTEDAELGESSYVTWTCPECKSKLAIYSDGLSKVRCECGLTWGVSVMAVGTKWVRNGNGA